MARVEGSGIAMTEASARPSLAANGKKTLSKKLVSKRAIRATPGENLPTNNESTPGISPDVTAPIVPGSGPKDEGLHLRKS